MKERILVVEDNRDMQNLLSTILKDEGYEISVVGDGNKAVREVRRCIPEIVLLDIKLPGMDGMQVLEEIKKIDKNTVVIMLTAYGDVRGAVKAIKLGAYDYITKPFDNDELFLAIRRALETHRLNSEVAALRKRLADKDVEAIIRELVGESPRIRQVVEKVAVVAPTNVTVVLEGESGTGKELIAQLIHQKSTRRDKAFVAIDCGAIPNTLVESELFGYEKGAFTGADGQKEGKFELTNGGTLFLDEITNLPDAAQAKLLRVIQEKKVQRLGSKKDTKIDVRIVAATNIDLSGAAKEGRFRSDLYYRINEFPIRLPPLRERQEDIPFLAQRFLSEAVREFNKEMKGFTTEAMAVLLNYSWPGNVRELRNVVRRAVLMNDSDRIEDTFLGSASPPPAGKNMEGSGGITDLRGELAKGASLHDIGRKVFNTMERDLITETLKITGGNKTKAAKALKIDRTTLYVKLKEYGIE